jgi:hypothetical protein
MVAKEGRYDAQTAKRRIMTHVLMLLGAFFAWSAFCVWLGWDERGMHEQEKENFARLDRIIEGLKS